MNLYVRELGSYEFAKSGNDIIKNDFFEHTQRILVLSTDLFSLGRIISEAQFDSVATTITDDSFVFAASKITKQAFINAGYNPDAPGDDFYYEIGNYLDANHKYLFKGENSFDLVISRLNFDSIDYIVMMVYPGDTGNYLLLNNILTEDGFIVTTEDDENIQTE